MDNILLSVGFVMMGLFGLMLSCYLTLCFIQWAGDKIDERIKQVKRRKNGN